MLYSTCINPTEIKKITNIIIYYISDDIIVIINNNNY
jgi:hypothetical protein